ncbi:MAG TPA: hypothetical protein VKA61_05550 [Sphingomicrobium sp.]|nr:hypothetical protein [Sphingomicrobium sp.]
MGADAITDEHGDKNAGPHRPQAGELRARVAGYICGVIVLLDVGAQPWHYAPKSRSQRADDRRDDPAQSELAHCAGVRSVAITAATRAKIG